MMLPRETLAEEWDEVAMPAYPPARYGSVQAGGIEPARADAIAKTLMAAENPVAFAAYLGRKPQAVAIFDRLARATGVRVAEFNAIDLNIRRIRRASPAADPLPLLEGADLGLLLDSDVPFVPQYARRANAMKWIQIDVDPLKADFPMWGFATDMRSRAIAPSCCNRCSTRSKPAPTSLSQARRRSHRELGQRSRGSAKRRATASANQGVSGALNPAFVFATLVRNCRRMISCSMRRSATDRSCRSSRADQSPRAMSALPAAGSAFPAAWRWG
jgi:Thiamine pyrophosphate-requiring enzymes [acetolactate synthase, pyruvate dehydrogenase (cytochrome), glyoxylate carboligase, phosphonopyruvate decarboxylase]